MESTRRRYGTRSHKAANNSPLRSLDDYTSGRGKKSQPKRGKNSTTTKPKAIKATDNADAQSISDARHQATTSPSQSPQPESHSEQDRAPESRSTSPPEQQESSHRQTRSSDRSDSPSHTLEQTARPLAKPATRKPKAVGRPRVNKTVEPPTHQGVGSPKANGKRTFSRMTDAEDADAEDAGDEGRSVKRSRRHHSAFHDTIELSEPKPANHEPNSPVHNTPLMRKEVAIVIDQSEVKSPKYSPSPVQNPRKRKELATEHDGSSEDDEDSAATARAMKRTRKSPKEAPRKLSPSPGPAVHPNTLSLAPSGTPCRKPRGVSPPSGTEYRLPSPPNIPNMFSISNHHTSSAGASTKVVEALEAQLALKDTYISTRTAAEVTPFALKVSNRLPPRPVSKRREAPIREKHRNDAKTVDEETEDADDSIFLSDEDKDNKENRSKPYDVNAARRKNKNRVKDNRRVIAIEKKLQEARSQIAKGKPLSPGFEQHIVSPEKPTNVLRAVHDLIVGNSFDPSEIIPLLENASADKHTLNGQKDVGQLEYAVSTAQDSNHDSNDESDVDDAPPSPSTLPKSHQTLTKSSTMNVGNEQAPSAPNGPATPARSALWSAFANVASVFTFKGKSTTNDPKTESAALRANNIPEDVTPTKPKRPVRAQTERRQHNQRRQQPERHRRQKQGTTLFSLRKEASAAPEQSSPKMNSKPTQHEALLTLQQGFQTYVQNAKAYVEAYQRQRGILKPDEVYDASGLHLLNFEEWVEQESRSLEFAAATRKGRTQSRADKDAEVDSEEHIRPTLTFTVPDGSDDEDDSSNTTSNSNAKAQAPTVQSQTPKVTSEEPRPTLVFAVPDDSDDEDETQTEEASNSTAQQSSILQPRQWDQTPPPPTPRPQPAQLPASVSKYVPKKPSGLRNVTAMSPIQQEQEQLTGEAKQRHLLFTKKISIDEYLNSFDDGLVAWQKELGLAEASFDLTIPL